MGIKKSRNRKTSENVSRYFSSWSSYLEYLQEPSTIPKTSKASSSETRKGSLDFTGTRNINDAISLSKTGYKVIVPDIMSRVVEIDHLIHKNDTVECIFMNTYSPVGMYDMGAVCSGNPESAINLTERESDDKNGNTVVVNFDLGMSFYYSSDNIKNKGATVVAFIYALEMSGYSVQVNAVTQMRDNDDSILMSVVRVKEYSDCLDLPALAFQIAHPSSLRRLGFRFLEIEGIKSEGYGWPVKNDPIGFITSMPKDEVFISGDFPSNHYDTAEGATEWITAKIKDIADRYK